MHGDTRKGTGPTEEQARRLDQAKRLLRSNQPEPARRLLESLLDSAAAASAYACLAQVHARRGDPGAAEQCLRRVIAIEPDSPDAHERLGTWYLSQGRVQEALQPLGRALALRPGRAAVVEGYAQALNGAGRLREAEAMYRRAVELSPDTDGYYCRLAAFLYTARRFEEMLSVLESGLARLPDSLPLLRAVGDACMLMRRGAEAVMRYERYLQLAPEDAAVHLSLARAYEAIEYPDQAITSYENAIALDADLVDAHVGIVFPLVETGRLDAARAHLDRAMALDPRNARAHYREGLYYEALGDLELARQSFRRSVALDPGNGNAFLHLVRLHPYTEPDSDVELMRAQMQSGTVPERERALIGFALGKVYEDLGESDQAFTYYQAANRLVRSGHAYDAGISLRLMRAIRRVFSGRLLTSVEMPGEETVTPIFVLGMPRSGTTLTEQILASHPQVFGAGELPHAIRLIDKHLLRGCGAQDLDGVVDRWRPEVLQALAGEYMAQVLPKLGSETHFVDKMPQNFLYLGLLRVIFPRAKIVHCTRDPMETCWSIYKNIFRHGHYYSNDLTDLGHYYAAYQALMAHWRSEFPGGFLEFEHEALLADQRTQTERLLNYCGLPWDEKCLAFHRSRRTITTASAGQVRRPLYKGNGPRWRRFEQQLQPLVTALHEHSPGE